MSEENKISPTCQRDQVDGVKSRGLDKEDDAPVGDTKVFNATRGNFFNSSLIGYSQYFLCESKQSKDFVLLL